MIKRKHTHTQQSRTYKPGVRVIYETNMFTHRYRQKQSLTVSTFAEVVVNKGNS